MKSGLFALLSAAVCAFLLSGCGGEPAAAGPDPSAVERSFTSADPTVKATIDKASEAVRRGDYNSAAEELERVMAVQGLSEEQAAAVRQLQAELRGALSRIGSVAEGEARKIYGGPKPPDQ